MMNRNAWLVAVFMLAAATAGAQTPEVSAIGPRIGAAAEDFTGIDQFGRPQTLKSAMGRDGLMLVFFRSADW